ncbi:hypothetical protein [Streptomyces dysideae]|uniref:hypothetical protein n=1 Tax=Streptomyces dysideae TaxID=909626 RepID=UPI000B32F18E|nr:hypothetical protein [Streptomyces dysideae]
MPPGSLSTVAGVRPAGPAAVPVLQDPAPVAPVPRIGWDALFWLGCAVFALLLALVTTLTRTASGAVARPSVTPSPRSSPTGRRAPGAGPAGSPRCSAPSSPR